MGSGKVPSVSRTALLAFAAGKRDEGVGIFIDYVLDDPRAWKKMSPADRADTMRDAHEWDVMMTSGTLFPEIDPAAIRKISPPVLVMSGGVSYKFLGYRPGNRQAHPQQQKHRVSRCRPPDVVQISRAL
ncbi:MAG: hypothetical protein ACREVO_11720 [Steroidobacteraceae bacterium]